MALYTISDTHLALSTDKSMDVFGPRWRRYTERLAEEWDKTIAEEDTVVIAGDISWAMHLEEAKEDFLFLESLKGTKIIGRGNHDYWWNTIKKMNAYLEEHKLRSIRFLYNNSYAVEGRFICGARGWWTDSKSAPDSIDYDKIMRREAARLELSIASVGKAEGERLVFLHFPPVLGNSVSREMLEILHKYDIKRCFYGHIHTVYDIPSVFVFEDISFEITSADYLQFKPLSV